MNQNYFIISIRNENTINVKKWYSNLTQPESLPGKFRQDQITHEVQQIIKNPTSLKGEKIRKIGNALFEALFDNDLRENFLKSYQEITKNKKQILNIILEINETALSEVVTYPWELMCLPSIYDQGDIHFATDRRLSFYRCRSGLTELSKLSINLKEGEKLKIALVVSKPTADPNLSNVEYQQVKEHLDNLDQQKVKFLPVMNSLDAYNIMTRLEDDQPDIFHFIGHGQLIEKDGSEIGQIAFVDEYGETDWKDGKMFSQLFTGHTPKIVLLQACETGKQSETNAFASVASQLMLQGIPVVIAMQYKVSNQTSGSFVKEFYTRIIQGNPVEIAVQKARSKLAFDNNNQYDKKDFAIPVIYMNAKDGYLFKQQENGLIIIDPTNKNDLIREIQDKYLPRQDDLKNIFLMNREIFGDNFYTRLEIKYNDFDTRIIYLVDELIDTGKLNKFLEIVRKIYPLFAK